MTYNPDYERSRMPNDGLGDYPNQYDEKPLSGKWLLITLAAILALFCGLAFFAGEGKVVVDENGTIQPLTTQTDQTIPTAPATE